MLYFVFEIQWMYVNNCSDFVIECQSNNGHIPDFKMRVVSVECMKSIVAFKRINQLTFVNYF